MANLTLDKLTKHFGSVVAVDGIDVEVEDGEFLCLLGPSGCGKSTALRMISGFEVPTAGDIAIDEASVVKLPPNRRPTALVFQQYTLWPHMTVADNIGFGLKLRGTSRRHIKTNVAESLELVGLAGYEDRRPSQLSGGQQQRVALARAIVLEPKILLLDEPFSSLDASLRVRLREEVKAIQRRLGITTIFVTHDQEEAMSLADRVAVMNQGRIEQLAAPSDMYAVPQTLFVADFIGEMNLIEAEVDGDRLRLGGVTLPAPDALGSADSRVTVALRPEDLSPVEQAAAHNSTDRGARTWPATIEQTMDLGHYIKAFARVDGIDPIKMFVPKSQPVSEGDQLHLRPSRCLVYADDQPPTEIVLTTD